MATKTAAKKKAKAARPTVSDVVDDVLKRRARALRARAQALAEIQPPVAAKAMKAVPKPTPHMALAAAATAATKGWLIAEGDSWFDYPGTDLLDALQQSAYDVESVARAGDRVEMMA